MALNITNAALYGSGVFTTIAIFDRKPFVWEKHWGRLAANAQKTGIDLRTHTEETTRRALVDQLELNGVIDGRARITFFDNRPSEIWPIAENCDQLTSLSIIVGKRRPVPDNFRLTVSPYSVNSSSPLTGVKSCNYLENLMAMEDAKTRGFDEAIRLNEHGMATSGAMANIFWLNGGSLYTPSLKTGCLPGTTREFVMENLEYREVEAPVEALNEAEAIFLTSAGLGVVSVVEFESRKLKKAEHPILNLMPGQI